MRDFGRSRCQKGHTRLGILVMLPCCRWMHIGLLITTTKETKSTKASTYKLRALRLLRGFQLSADETGDRQNLVAASIASQLYFGGCCKPQWLAFG